MQRLLFVFLFILIITGCRKDNPGQPLDEYRLSAYTKDHYRYTFEYDDRDKPVKYGTYYDDQLIFDTQLFYAGGRIDSLISVMPSGPMQYQTFRYRDDTLIVSTYRYAFDETVRMKYLINDNRIVKIMHPPCGEGDTAYLCFYRVLHWDNSNLAYKHTYSGTGWVYPDYKLAGGTELTNTVWSTYDNHPNPLKSIYSLIYPGEYESSENNLLRMVITDMAGDTLIRIFNHTYNDLGLPVATTIIREKNDTPLNDPVSLEPSYLTYTYEKYR